MVAQNKGQIADCATNESNYVNNHNATRSADPAQLVVQWSEAQTPIHLDRSAAGFVKEGRCIFRNTTQENYSKKAKELL